MSTIDNYINPYGYIYMIRNTVNDKKYIGQTTTKLNKRARWTINGLRKYNRHLVFSLEKYGIENFERKILSIAINKKQLNQLEKNYIKKYNTINQDFGYNLMEGGHDASSWNKGLSKEKQPFYNRKHTKETKKKISMALTGRKLSEETKKKLSDINKGKIYSKEYKEKMSNILKGTRKGTDNSFFGKKHSEETKKKISENSKKYWNNEEYRIKQSNSSKKAWTEERRKERSEKYKGKNNPNWKGGIK